jgi:hypothetical protein
LAIQITDNVIPRDFCAARDATQESNRIFPLIATQQEERYTRAEAGATVFAIANRKSKIESVVVPVVQRIERGFPKP